jgi:hypothetical protein
MKRLLRLTGGCLALAALWTSAPAAAADAFARHFALQLEDGAAFYSVTLSAPVYEASRRGDLGDLRVFNGAGEAVPYSLDAPREPARIPPALRQVRWFPLSSAATGDNGPPPGVAMSADGSLRATSAPPPRARRGPAASGRCSCICVTTTTRVACASRPATICVIGSQRVMRNCSRSTTTAAP